MNNRVETLAEAVDRLREIVECVEDDVRTSTPGWHKAPWIVQESSGRYILLDAYAALVTGMAALEATPAAPRWMRAECDFGDGFAEGEADYVDGWTKKHFDETGHVVFTRASEKSEGWG